MTQPLDAEIVFTAVVPLPRMVTPADVGSSKLFSAEPQTGLPRDLGAVDADSVVPWTLTPTNVFQQALLNSLRDEGIDIPEKKLPIDLTLDDGAPARMSLRLSLFVPCVAIVSASLRGLVLPGDRFPDQLIAWEKDVPAGVRSVLENSVGLIASQDHRRIEPLHVGRVARAVRLRLPHPAETIHAFVKGQYRQMVGIVHHESEWKVTTDDLVDKVVRKNDGLNAHAQAPYRLIDKQGFVQVEGDPPGTPPFERLVQWQALALAFREFLRVYRAQRSSAPRTFDLVLAKIEAWVRDPSRVIGDSVTGRATWALACDELQLRGELERTTTPEVRDRLGQAVVGHDALGSSWWAKADLEGTLAGLDVAESSDASGGGQRSPATRALRDARRAYLAGAPTASLLASRWAAETLLRDHGVNVDGLDDAPGLKPDVESLLAAHPNEDRPDEEQARRALETLEALAAHLRARSARSGA